jgi:hypothetical protein
VKPFPFAALVPTTPFPDCFSVMVLVEFPFKPVCSTFQVPVTLGGLATAAASASDAIAPLRTSGIAKLFN